MLVLAMFTFLAACGQAAAPADKAAAPEAPVEDDAAPETETADTLAAVVEPKKEIGHIADERLVGEWMTTSVISEGEYVFDLNDFSFMMGSMGSTPLDITMLYSGGCYGEFFETVYDYETAGGTGVTSADVFFPCDTVVVGDGTLSFPNAANGARDGKLDCTIEYSFQNVDESSHYDDAAVDALFAAAEDDQLTLVIKGTYAESATKVLTIDTTVVYEKQLLLGRTKVLTGLLQGSWKDDLGNTWDFSVASHQEKVDDETRESFGLVFTLTDTAGKKYNSEPFDGSSNAVTIGTYKDPNDENGVITGIDFDFASGQDIDDVSGILVSCDGDHFVLNTGNGKEMSFTRVQ